MMEKVCAIHHGNYYLTVVLEVICAEKVEFNVTKFKICCWLQGSVNGKLTV